MAASKVIRVDADVYAAIERQGKFGESTNAVLRRMLNMTANAKERGNVRTVNKRDKVRA